MDCFAVSLTLGASRRLTWKDVLVMAFFFGFFQGAIPVVGWLLGNSIQSFIEMFDHWIAFAILAIIGMKMIWQSFHTDSDSRTIDIRKTSVLLGLSLATSIDALITGIGFGFIRVNIVNAVALIAVVTFSVTIIGARLGHRSRLIPARWAEFAGGLILIAIGMKIVIDHLSLL